MLRNKKQRNTLIISAIIGILFYFGGAVVAGGAYFILGNNADEKVLLGIMKRIISFAVLMSLLVTAVISRRVKNDLDKGQSYGAFVIVNAIATAFIPFLLIVMSEFE